VVLCKTCEAINGKWKYLFCFVFVVVNLKGGS